MAITVTDLQPIPSGFALNGTSADASGCEELKAAPGAGVSIYLEGLIVTSDSAISITVGAGETASAVTNAIIGPVYFAADATYTWKFNRPIKVAANTSLTVDASGAGNICVYAEGHVR